LERASTQSYFIRRLNDAGWKLTRYNLGISGHTDAWIAAKAGLKDSSSAVKSTSHAYDVDPEIEVIRLRKLVEGYEQGRFIRTMNWLKGLR